MIELIVLVSRHVVDVMVRFDGSDGCRIARHYCGRISRNRRLGVNRGRDHGGRQQCHRRRIQLPHRCFSVRCTVVCHRFCHFIRARRYITSPRDSARRVRIDSKDGCGIKTNQMMIYAALALPFHAHCVSLPGLLIALSIPSKFITSR